MLLLSAAFSGPAWAITGGEPDEGRHPNVGAMRFYHPALGIMCCSGTLIHPRVFLTAGHVVAAFQTGEAVLLGVSFDQEADLEDETAWRPFTQAVCSYTAIHGGGHGRTDIGLVVLKDPVKSVAPATLPAAGFLDDLKEAGQFQAGPKGTRLTVVGYGMLLDWPPPEAFWQDPPLRNTAQSGYLGLHDGWLGLNQNLAAGYGGAALGDSGGPVFWTDPDTGDEILVSITSWGGSLVGNGWYYRIDTVESLKFIQDVINSLEE
jgi:secreted trypsin-like serine protease